MSKKKLVQAIPTPGAVVAYKVDLEDEVAANIGTVAQLLADGYQGVYVTLSRPCGQITQAMEARGISKDHVAFVDAVTESYREKKLEAPNVVYVSGPMNIDGIQEGIRSAMGMVSGEKRFLLLDSVTHILLYNTLERTVEFCHKLAQVLRKEDVAGIYMIVSMGATDPKLIDGLQKIADAVAEFKEAS